MGKGLRSKVKRRFRTIKRIHVREHVEKPNLKKLNDRIKSMLNNKDIYQDLVRPPNKFLHPDDENAVIPQHKITKKIDFRSEALPLSGFATVGNRRKYNLTEQMSLKNEFGGNANFFENTEVSKMIEEMHKRSKEVMKVIKNNEQNDK
ncbi:hypothetical protein PFAG_02370 [Plasmodium falciparum Santa Lucia]|uniref:DUF2423 domain-containing protein n=14 Tax=Plasmodium (Laverania) TaxID=418107 RepID=Q8I322_PLAF7|nr:conserved protein, unknown function [Plasmodium falciparum 3D7]ETW38299.1 hypothetical protein PFTANZ_01031 [Plasmodium falciparum Tanzania (2000708)]ETW43067.1 hypothetical protein PFNF135_02542 [Plasmodium falciparum NF135/5.C10]ETW49488.1 hypothetical protein PFMALIP_02416 [Plasmodium falciparum MaliPS096_E11]ETW61730.1 hypothetical protein PFMC_02382 [Plasmodium falciparum CAMP/Malaysia]EUR72368.1 hypothetical protein PFBG_02462 [Plasmodium falciparum 7G8]EUT86501.1 hypothetical protei|eukprot:XP_001352002.1 conserved protein, unknown function [Plasmodium falciparum 3D7]